jgi:hypothetical protein
MATLLIGAAINIGASILINRFFGPEGQDIVQEGPRLRDLSVTSAAYGEVRSIGFGSFRVGGNMIWSPGIREIVRSQRQDAPGKGGGGGGSVTTRTFEYRASFAVGFGEGPAQEVLKLWADSKLVYDATGETTGLGKFRFRFHPGDEEQLPDPLIEADKGAGNVPAYRGETYIVCDDWPLADFGNRVPNLTALITYQATEQKLLRNVDIPTLPGTGATGPESIGMYNRRDDTWYVSESTAGEKWNVGGQFLINSEEADQGFPGDESRMFGPDGFHYRIAEFGTNFSRWRKTNPYTGDEIYQFDGPAFGFSVNPFLGVMQTVLPGIGPVVTQWANGSSLSFGGPGRVYIENNDGEGNTLLDTVDELTVAPLVIFDPYNHERVFWTNEDTSQTILFEGLIVPTIGLLGGISATPEVVEVGRIQKNGIDIPGAGNVLGWCWLPLQNSIILSYVTGIVKFDFDVGAITATNNSVSFHTLAQWSDSELFAWGEFGGDFITIAVDDLSIVDREPVNSFFMGSSAGFWNERNTTYIPATHSVIGVRAEGTQVADPPTAVQVFLNRTTGGGADLADIVSTLCLKSGLTAADIDVTGLVGITVDGFVLNNQTPLKDALRPLSRAFLFDAVESDFQIKFIRRGGALALAAPIPADDIGLANGGDDEPFRETRTQELELPRRVWVQYADKAQDYQQASQPDARMRNPDPAVRTDAEVTLNLPMALTASQARQIAQRQLFITWAERRSFEFSLPWTYLALDPTDSVEAVLDTETARLRINQIEVGADLTLLVQATLEDEDADTSVIPGDAGGGFVVPVVPDRAPSRLFVLNLPLLRNQDASLQEFSRGYFSMAGQSDRWPGAVLTQSRDQGATYQEIASQPGSGPWGVVTTALPDPVTTATWNPDQSFNVTMISGSDELQTRTQLEVLNGANVGAVIRRNGSAELVQWTTVVDNGDGTFTLSNLLRGQRGTDNEAFGHVSGEFFVIVSFEFTNSLRNELDQINVAQLFRPVTLGTLIEDAADVFATYTGRDLKPYPVSSLTATDSGGDIVIDWLRQTRFGGELRDGTDDVPLNETIERYEIEIIRGSTLLNTYGDAAPFIEVTNFTYTSTQQTADGVASADVLTIRVYQISAIVGRGSFRDVTFIKP